MLKPHSDSMILLLLDIYLAFPKHMSNIPNYVSSYELGTPKNWCFLVIFIHFPHEIAIETW